MSGEEILNYYYKNFKLKQSKYGWIINFNFDFFKGKTLPYNLINNNNGKILLEKGIKLTARIIKDFQNKKYKEIAISNEDIMGMFISEDLINEKTGQILVEAGTEIIDEHLNYFEKNNIDEIFVLLTDNIEVGPYLRNTLALDKSKSREESLFEIYKILRPGEPPTLETAEILFRKLFFSSERYDLSAVGRVKMNSRLKLSSDEEARTLRKSDILEIIKVLLDLRHGKGEVDDIDHLGNRRVRSVGELLENQFRIGLLRMERAIK